MTVKSLLLLQKIPILNKCYSFEVSVDQRILNKKMHHSFNTYTKKVNININIKHVRMKDCVTLKTGVMAVENSALQLQE